ncbi:DUF4044 domain-containing protein [Clostridium fallax]|uniref:DUF4044 domain-containing protein n=1 Tax=Clostridium fallax TaxID=1533 RepID=A0A1M4UW90_9CLOT|nr:DUF4044 domain-containing protein [Clostridium fallax]SHE60883.1 hypothetical protein SAMN05443638_10629 [Clostridium fallax]SQB06841.1 Uncharacterised protein [Clostridium fallax]
MKKKTREKMTKILIGFVLITFILTLLPVLFR